MDADTASYFLTELTAADTSPERSEYLETLRFARLLREGFPPVINSAPNVTQAATLAGRPPISLLYRTMEPSDESRAPLVLAGLTVSTD